MNAKVIVVTDSMYTRARAMRVAAQLGWQTCVYTMLDSSVYERDFVDFITAPDTGCRALICAQSTYWSKFSHGPVDKVIHL